MAARSKRKALEKPFVRTWQREGDKLWSIRTHSKNIIYSGGWRAICCEHEVQNTGTRTSRVEAQRQSSGRGVVVSRSTKRYKSAVELETQVKYIVMQQKFDCRRMSSVTEQAVNKS
jgi:hypothetical protein